MRRRGQRVALVAAAAAVALALAGAAVAALHGHAGTTVKVTEREYHITLSKASLAAGTVTFAIHNAGKLAHGLALAGAGLKTVKIAHIAPGATRTLTVKVAGGTLSLWCPVPGHAALGMKASLAVKGAAASGGASSGGTTTTGGGNAWG